MLEPDLANIGVLTPLPASPEGCAGPLWMEDLNGATCCVTGGPCLLRLFR